MNIDKDDYII